MQRYTAWRRAGGGEIGWQGARQDGRRRDRDSDWAAMQNSAILVRHMFDAKDESLEGLE